MAELAVLGTVVNVLTLIDLACKTVSRIKEFTDTAVDLPEILSDTVDHISILPIALKKLQGYNVSQEGEILSVLNGFNRTIERLEIGMKKITPLPTDSKASKVGKAFKSFRVEKEIEKLTAKLLIHHNQLQTFLMINSACTTTVSLGVTTNREPTFLLNKYFKHRDSLDQRHMEEMEPWSKNIGSALLLPSSTIQTPLVFLPDILFHSPTNSIIDPMSVAGYLCQKFMKRSSVQVIIQLSGWEMLVRQRQNNQTFEELYSSYMRQLLNRLNIPTSLASNFRDLWLLVKTVLEDLRCSWLMVLDAYFVIWLSVKGLLLQLPQSPKGGLIIVWWGKSVRDGDMLIPQNESHKQKVLEDIDKEFDRTKNTSETVKPLIS